MRTIWRHGQGASPWIRSDFFKYRSRARCLHKKDRVRRNYHGNTIVRAQEELCEEPDWDHEMSIFKKRVNKPSHLEALRKIEAAKVDVGRVLYSADGIAIISGLNNDAEVGTALAFSSGAVGTLLWRRSDNYVFALILAGFDLVSVGDGVECRVRAILQVVDESEGPSTKREYELTRVPAGEALRCKVVDYLGRPLAVSIDGHISLEDGIPMGTDIQIPMVNAQPDMESREQIAEALFTGVKAVDILTPLGRGQALLVVGPEGSGKTQLCLDSIVGQRDSGDGVRCVYAAVGCTGGQLARTLLQLRASGCMGYTTVVAAPEGCSLGEQYATILTACSIAEATRDNGGHALVVYNDVSALVNIWERISVASADLGVSLESAKDEAEELKQQREIFAAQETEIVAEMNKTMLQDMTSNRGDDMDSEEQGDRQEQTGSISKHDGNEMLRNESTMGKGNEKQSEEEEGLVEYEGMLISITAAQRRRFFSSLIQRSAKLHRRLGGGSLTTLLVCPGVPASGNVQAAQEKIAAYKHLREDQKAKLLSALESTRKSGMKARERSPKELSTEVVEELMSIADGQIVLQSARDKPTGGVTVDPRVSVSRIGSRALSPAVATLAPKVRFDLVQAEDAKRFAISGDDDVAAARALKRAAVAAASMPQRPRTVCPLEAQTVQLLALSKGLLDTFDPEDVSDELQRLTHQVQKECPDVMAEIAKTRRLTAEAEAVLIAALENVSKSYLS